MKVLYKLMLKQTVPAVPTKLKPPPRKLRFEHFTCGRQIDIKQQAHSGMRSRLDFQLLRRTNNLEGLFLESIGLQTQTLQARCAASSRSGSPRKCPSKHARRNALQTFK